MGYMFKLTVKSIKDRFGRYLAILLIVLISVAFFSGLKVTKKAMSDTCDSYLAEQQMYDFRLLSTLGFTEEDAESFSALDGISRVEVQIPSQVPHLHGVSLPPKRRRCPTITEG